MKNKKPD